MAWTCANCGTKNEHGLFNFCKKCGSTPSREPTAAGAQPTARSARPEATQRPSVVESTWQQSSSRQRRRRSGGGFLVVVLLVLVAAGAVVAVASRVDVRDAVDDALRDLTQEETGVDPAMSAGTDPGVLGEFTDDLLVDSILAEITATDGTTAPEETGATTTAPAVAPVLEPLAKRDARCAARWNGKQNARARRLVAGAADGEATWAGVQLTGANSGSVQPDVCVIIFGTQPDPTQPRLRPGDVYAEAGPASGPRLPFVRLGSVSLSYQWNARVAKDGRILTKPAG